MKAMSLIEDDRNLQNALDLVQVDGTEWIIGSDDLGELDELKRRLTAQSIGFEIEAHRNQEHATGMQEAFNRFTQTGLWR